MVNNLLYKHSIVINIIKSIGLKVKKIIISVLGMTVKK